MRIRQDESGQVLVLTALSMAAILGFLALAIDVGLLFNTKRDIQIAADAAATAAALDYSFNASTSSATTVADLAANANGVATSNVTVNFGSSGSITTPYHNSAGYVEVIISQPSQTFFMRAFSLWTGGNKFAKVPVAARAVAGTPGPSNACVYILDPTADDALDLQGSFTVTAANCGIVVDSNASDALNFTGGGGTLTAGSVSVVGGDSGHTGDSTPAPVTGATPVNNPLPNLTGPIPPAGCTYTSSATSVASGNPSISAGGVICYTKAVSMSNVTLAPGIYVFENGVTLGGTITSGTTGVPGGTTLDVYGGSFNLNTGTTLAVTPPTSGSLEGVVLMQPASNSNEIQIQKGDSFGSLSGIIYAPTAELYLQDSGGDKSGGVTLNTDLIVGTLFDKTATLTINSYSQSNPTLTPLKAVSLVE